ncbi:hypothetical protein JOF53_002370 [Crossiella equi]|uniref:Tail assembly chaperone n=1 Tax=Crossiella equi TaxID=130796 RepID=A0ABS5AA91_9PSEU|nr:hypothetical protein [Crossiella equi]MBP2473498.1 hypothetical protein [Crossiella equi]
MSQYEIPQARDFDPLQDFDPTGQGYGPAAGQGYHPEREWARDWVRERAREELHRAWVNSTGGTKSENDAVLDDIEQGVFLELMLTIEDLAGLTLLAVLHEFNGTSIDDFVEFVVGRTEEIYEEPEAEAEA